MASAQMSPITVTSIVGRADILASIFFFTSILVYHGPAWPVNKIGLSILLGVLSMFSKEQGIMSMLVNAAIDLFKSWVFIKRSIVEWKMNDVAKQFYKRIFIMTLSFILLLSGRIALLQGSMPNFNSRDNPAAFHPDVDVRFLTYSYLAAFNWWMMLYPMNLSHDWQMNSIPLVTDIYDPRNIFTLMVFGLIGYHIYRCFIGLLQQKHTSEFVGTLLLILPFIPASNLLLTVGFVVAERVLYIPSSGFILLMTCAIQAIWTSSRNGKFASQVLIAFLLICGAIKTIDRNMDWQSKESLLRSDIVTLPNNPKLHFNYANFYKINNQKELAIAHYNEAIRLWPTYASAYNNLGILTSSEEHFLQAVAHSKYHYYAHYNLGVIYMNKNMTNESLSSLEKCLLINPHYHPALNQFIQLASEKINREFLKKINTQHKISHHYMSFGQQQRNDRHFFGALKAFKLGFLASEMTSFKDGGDLAFIRELYSMSKHFRDIHKMKRLIFRWRMKKNFVKNYFENNLFFRQWKLNHGIKKKAALHLEDIKSVVNLKPDLNYRAHLILEPKFNLKNSIPIPKPEHKSKIHPEADLKSKSEQVKPKRTLKRNKEGPRISAVYVANEDYDNLENTYKLFDSEPQFIAPDYVTDFVSKEDVNDYSKDRSSGKAFQFHTTFNNVYVLHKISGNFGKPLKNQNLEKYIDDTLKGEKKHRFLEKNGAILECAVKFCYVFNESNFNDLFSPLRVPLSLLDKKKFKCDVSNMMKIQLIGGECFYATRYGNILSICSKKCRPN